MLHTECHFFCIAAYKLVQHRKWASRVGLCATIKFDEIDQFSAKDIRDLRDMREHVIEYFEGLGREKKRWVVETTDFKADASSLVGTMIGGSLDWRAFAAAAHRLRPLLLAEPIPYPA
jgi:hypothetical protein